MEDLPSAAATRREVAAATRREVIESSVIASSQVNFSLNLGHGGGFGGGGYQQVSVGHQSNEGAHVDQELLHKIKEILLQQENLGGGGGHGGYSGGHSGGHGISSSYGPPQISSSYGPPGHGSSRVVGIDFGHVVQGHQVAQYLKHEASAGHGYAPSSSYGAPSFSSPSSSYGAPIQSFSAPSFSAPSSSYGAPSFSRPSSSYGAPSRPSSSYGVPH